MKEQIYTIPVVDAFNEDSECAICTLERKLEDQYIEYFLGPSLMEPDCRIETNEKGFCTRHFELLYNRQENRLGLGLIVDTHLQEQNKELKKMYSKKISYIQKESETTLVKSISNKLTSKKTSTEKFVENMVQELASLEKKCMICGKMSYTMERYIDVIFYLWFKEREFRDLFNNNKGFCLVHFRQLLESMGKYLNSRDMAIFADNLLKMQLKNMERVQQEVNWFTEKFDYRNNDAPWGNSKDALPRSIQKITGYCNLK
ncbi:MAG TPA: DUF6062 family protein [Clostridiales bacterium]|nr:DUF6062 family protein [Clostridiales bacterium]